MYVKTNQACEDWNKIFKRKKPQKCNIGVICIKYISHNNEWSF